MAEFENPASFSRRTFIGGAAVLATTGALVGCTAQKGELSKTGENAAQTERETQIMPGICRGDCYGGCALNLHIRDGKLVRTSARDLPDTSYNRICSKGLSHVEKVYSSERLQYPMRRVGERGEGKFERISWDEAIDMIASTWKRIADEHGSEAMSIFFGGGTSASAGSGFNEESALNRLAALMGSSYITQSVDMAINYGVGKAFGAVPTDLQNDGADYINSKTIVCWGANPLVSVPQLGHFILEAKDNGTKYIVIDPVFNANASKADLFVPIKPSTDAALALAMIKIIIDEGIFDEEFVKAHTEAAVLVKEDGTQLRASDFGIEPVKTTDADTGEEVTVDPLMVLDHSANDFVELDKAEQPVIEGVGEANGIKVLTQFEMLKNGVEMYTPEYAESVTGVSAAIVRELARVYVEDGPVNTISYVGPDHYGNGHYFYWALAILALLTGNVGKSGAAIGWKDDDGLDDLLDVTLGTDPVNKAGEHARGAGQWLHLNSIGDIVSTGTYNGEAYPLKGCWICFGNPLATNTNSIYTQEWISGLEFVVVSDLVMTETAKWADVLLPVSHWFETTELCGTYHTHPFCGMQTPVLEPQFESKPDFEIWKLMGQALGFEDYFDFNAEEYISMLIDTEAAREVGLTMDALKNGEAVRIYKDDPHIAFKDAVFPTATGRGMLYCEEVVPAYDTGQSIDESLEHLPSYVPAFEADVKSEVRERYPYVLITENMRTRTHTEWWDVKYLSEYERQPVLRVNPNTAKKLGIQDGDKVKIFNDRGYLVLLAITCPGVPEDVVTMPGKWQRHEYIDGSLNDLTTERFNQVCENMLFYDVAVDIEKL
ncbi:molybdopterin-dependent oxidoreductase [Adlercreutzia sp. R21]|uniref:molybdopterin-containing oxidoreductase family protein n=1 Tax=Adlercreutzia wanghongyangiae TaxID=3111451 RepID=UPI002DB9D710|nr:molybdopterin-dependent oxidoreductase [Adlercreutzia sp. R21]MEC4184648.1 molybdopterin-dependent oxidoreductase [Adlercreutzia sp. R21]